MSFHLSVPHISKLKEVLAPEVSVQDYKSFYHVSGFHHPVLPVITSQEPHQLQLLSWGLVPHDTVLPGAAKAFQDKTLNAKAETLFSDPLYFNYAPHNRCLIFADGFFDWKQKGKEKIPHFIFLKDHKPFAIAGVYAEWFHPQFFPSQRFSLITTAADGVMSFISNVKNRMPLILPPDKWNDWLNTSLPPADIQQLMHDFDSDAMQAYEIGSFINDGGNTDIPEVQNKTGDFKVDAGDMIW